MADPDRILINAATYGGKVKAEFVEPDLQEVRGKRIKDFAAEDFDIFRADSIAHPLSWRGSSDLSSLRGRRLMLRMSMYHTDLYSITV